MVKLEKVTRQTFKSVINLKVKESQKKFVADNVVSLAEAWLEYYTAIPYAIKADNEVVGFVMLDYDKRERTIGLWRFMIDEKYQNKGYGKSALEIIINDAKKAEDIDAIYLDYVKENTEAKALYSSFGFVETGEVENEEIVMYLKVNNNPKLGFLRYDKSDIDDFLKIIENNKFNIDKKDILNDKSQKIIRITYYGKTIGFILKKQEYIDSKFVEIYNKLK